MQNRLLCFPQTGFFPSASLRTGSAALLRMTYTQVVIVQYVVDHYSFLEKGALGKLQGMVLNCRRFPMTVGS